MPIKLSFSTVALLAFEHNDRSALDAIKGARALGVLPSGVTYWTRAGALAHRRAHVRQLARRS